MIHITNYLINTYTCTIAADFNSLQFKKKGYIDPSKNTKQNMKAIETNNIGLHFYHWN